jgi:hypothetical protein
MHFFKSFWISVRGKNIVIRQDVHPLTIDIILRRLLTAIEAGIHAMNPLSPTVAPLQS